MSDTEKTSIIDSDGLAGFGEYLNTLHGTGYTFEMEDAQGRLVDRPLDEVICCFQSYCGSDAERFRVRICYVDHQAPAMGLIDREFKRLKRAS